MLTLCLLHNTYFSRQGTPTLRQNCAIALEIRRISQTGKETLTHLHDMASLKESPLCHHWLCYATCSHLPQELERLSVEAYSL